MKASTRKVHKLKTWPPYFQQIVDGKKTFELRVNDRGYQEGDILVLEEYLPETKEYTGRNLEVAIGIMIQGEWGLDKDVACMSLVSVSGLISELEAKAAAYDKQLAGTLAHGIGTTVTIPSGARFDNETNQVIMDNRTERLCKCGGKLADSGHCENYFCDLGEEEDTRDE